MPLILPGNVASATAGAYEVANSCRFFTDTVMKRTNAATSTNGTQGCFSTWIKKCNISGTGGGIITGYVDASNFTVIYFDSDHRLCFLEYQSGSSAGFLRTPNIFRDPSAWMHIAYLIDTTQGTAANRVKCYINGTQITSFHSGGTTQPAQDLTLKIFAASTSLDLGQDTGGSPHFMNGYLAETLLVDGTTVAIGDLGEFDEDSPTIWKPKDISGISVGTNGFYLDYEDSANLGNAVDGGTDLTETNLAATDQATDTPTNSFATWNSLAGYYYAGTFSEGNCKTVSGTSEYGFIPSNIGVSSGKWYCEINNVSATSGDGDWHYFGIVSTQGTGTTIGIGKNANDYGIRVDTSSLPGQIRTGDSHSSYGVALADGDTLGIYLDLDNNKLYFAKDGVLMNSGTGISITAPASTSLGAYFFAYSYEDGSGTGTVAANFGGCSSFTVSSSNTDANGYGNFEFSPNDDGNSSFDSAAKDFYALCTKNLAEYG